MASGTATPEAGKSDDRPRPDDQFDTLIDQRLRQTRRQMAGVDIVGGLVVSAVGLLVYLLAVAILDHWLVPGGLGFWGRLLCLVGLLGGLGFYLRLRVLPPLIRRINPVYAAHTIEQSRPSLKNSLINFLLLRSHRREVHKAVYKALQQRAADDVNGVPIESAVDRTPVIRLGYLLAGVLAACCLYFVISPKSPLVSAARIIWPWADIQAPTRVTIEQIKPGDTVGFNGEQITVSAEVDGVRADEPVTLYYSTADGQSVDQAVPLSIPERGYRYSCVLPPGSLGLQQNMEYRLVAGDCRTRTFSITVQIPPAIVVDSVTYEYPAYTEIPTRTVDGQGDIRAIEGTRVTINAEANLPIGRAEIDLNCNGRQRLKMKADGKLAVGSFTLRAGHESYQLTFSDEAGRANRRPIRHAIEVIADMPPRIELVDPPEEQIQLPENGVLELHVRAEDPDFALRRVSIRAEREGRSLPIRPLLDKPRPEQPLRGDFQTTYRFQPEQFGLMAGDRIVYFAEAQDNKSPVPNRTETRRRWITIVPPQTQDQPRDKQQEQQDKQQGKSQDQQDDKQDQPEGKQDQQERMPDQQEGKQDQQEPKQDQQDQQEGKQGQQEEGKQDEQESKQDKQQGEQDEQQGSEPGQSGKEAASDQSGKQGESSQSGETMPGEAGGGESGGQGREPIDGQSNPGDAVEEILKHRQQQKGQPADKPSDQQPADGQQQAADQPPGQKSSEPGASQQKGDGEQKPSGDGQKSEPRLSDRQEGEWGEKSEAEKSDKQKSPDNAQGDSQGAEKSDKPGPGKGAQSKAKGEPGEKEPMPGQSKPEPKPDATGGDPNDSKGDPGAGKPSKDDQTGSPSPQEGNQQRDKKPGDKPDQAGEKNDEKGDSPSNSPKDSDSQGDTAGDRSGGGKKGGGQRSDQSGTGSAGKNTAADQGGSQSDQKGEGETGEKAGDQIESDRPTGKSAPKGDGAGSQGGGKPGSKTPDQDPQDQPGQEGQNENGRPGQSDKPSQKMPEDKASGKPQGHGPGNPTAGGGPRKHSDLKPTPDAELAPGEDPNLDYARKQTVLALEHLKDQLAKEQPDAELLDRLGWTREDMTRFAERWERMRRDAAGRGPDASSAKKEFDEAVRSLGLRRGLTELKGGRIEADKPGGMKDSRRVAPPADWAEQFRAYSRGVAGGKP